MRFPWLSTSIGLALCIAIAAPARAERAADGTITAFELPGFVTMDRASEESFAEVAAGMSFFEGDDPDFNARLDLYGQYLTASGAGGYAALPVSLLVNNDENETAVGNVELGALYNLRASPRTAVALRGGLALPTADEDLAGGAVNYLTAYSRFTDRVSIAANTTWLRLAASPMYRHGQFFARVDMGLDLAVDEPEGVDIDPLARLNLGVGFTNGAIAVMGELLSTGTTGDVALGDDRFHYAAALSARGGMGSGVQGFAAIVLPVGEESSSTTVDFVLIAGARIPIEH